MVSSILFVNFKIFSCHLCVTPLHSKAKVWVQRTFGIYMPSYSWHFFKDVLFSSTKDLVDPHLLVQVNPGPPPWLPYRYLCCISILLTKTWTFACLIETIWLFACVIKTLIVKSWVFHNQLIFWSLAVLLHGYWFKKHLFAGIILRPLFAEI